MSSFSPRYDMPPTPAARPPAPFAPRRRRKMFFSTEDVHARQLLFRLEDRGAQFDFIDAAMRAQKPMPCQRR